MNDKEQVINKQARNLSKGLAFEFPWITLFASLVLIAYFIVLQQPHLVEPYYLLEDVKSPIFQWSLIAVYLYLLASDVFFFIRRQKKKRAMMAELRKEVDDLWRAKRKVQQKAHVYSGHADKLKLFISEKLLEYIEYDEKFLHFKSIAAEVRHNGVISYDKVRSALQLANDSLEHASQDRKKEKIYLDALDAMKYLWDLLDLSTADNIALHVANHLISCEEIYYQEQLRKSGAPNDTGDVDSAYPVTPIFDPNHTLQNMLLDMIGSSSDSIDQEKAPCGVTANEEAQPLECEEFRLGLYPTNVLLGNKNHFVLIAENLIKNAQFFHGKRSPKQRSDKVAVLLQQIDGFVELAVYNRGAHISDDIRQQIFQLGFSTRRAKEHHGKGLGLFFVNEVVKGYEGLIEIENIANPKQTLAVRMVDQNNAVTTRVLHIEEAEKETCIYEDRSYNRLDPSDTNENILSESDATEVSNKLVWEFDSTITSIEVSATSTGKTHIFSEINATSTSDFLDVFSPFIPGWKLSVNNTYSKAKVSLTALDRTGVCFKVKLPDVDSRLNDEQLIKEGQFDGEVKSLEQRFKEYDDL